MKRYIARATVSIEGVLVEADTPEEAIDEFKLMLENIALMDLEADGVDVMTCRVEEFREEPE